MTGPHLGVVLPNYGEAFDPGRLAATAVAAEEAGLDSGWVTDHVLPPSRHAAVYGTVAEALVTVGFLAGRTRRLRVGVSALVVPQREPLLTLKQLLSLDVLSGGRLITAVAGGGLELWVAGVSRHTLRRAARTGVWHPVALSVRELRSMAAGFRALVPEGRVVLRLGVALRDRIEEDATDERGRHMVAGPASWVGEQLNDYLEAGADGFVVNLDHRAAGLEDRIAAFAADVAPMLMAPARRG